MFNKFTAAKNLIDKSQNILIATHEKPDGDAIGSMLAMKIALDKLGKKIALFCFPATPKEYAFLPQINQIKNEFCLNNVDLIIGLDYGDFARLNLGEKENLSQFNVLTIDHHSVGDHIGVQIIETESSSTCEIIYNFLKFLEIEISPEIATCLLTGIYDDTGGFRHPNTNAKTLEIAGNLLKKGALIQKITSSLAENDPKTQTEIWHKIISQLKIDTESEMAYSVLNYKSLSSFANNFKTSNIINILDSIPETKLTLLLTETEPGKIDGSLRCKKDSHINVAKIAKSFGGGGHKLAAGFAITGISSEEIINQIKDLLKNSKNLNLGEKLV